MLELLSGKKFSIISEYPKYFDKPEYEKASIPLRINR